MNQTTYFGVEKTHRPWLKRLDDIPEDMKTLMLEGSMAGGTETLIDHNVPEEGIMVMTNNDQEYKEMCQSIKKKKFKVQTKKGWICDEIDNGYQYIVHDGMCSPYGGSHVKSSIIASIKNMFKSEKPWYHFEATLIKRLRAKGSNIDTALSNLMSIIMTMAKNSGYKMVNYHEDDYIGSKGSPIANPSYVFKKVNNISLKRATRLNTKLFKKFRKLRKIAPTREWTDEDLK